MLPDTGPISLKDINIELSKTSYSQISLNDINVRNLAKITKGSISFANLRGKEDLSKKEIYIIDTMQKALKIWDDLYEKYGANLSNIIVKIDDSITDLNGGGTKGNLITHSPYRITGKNLKNISFLFVTFTSLTTISKVIFDNCHNLESVQSTFDGCINADFIPELWNKDKFPKITSYSFYANSCTKAKNYNNIPSEWK